VLGILAPYKKGNSVVHGNLYRDGENADMLRPGDIANASKSDAVELPTNPGIRRELEMIHTEVLDVLDVPPSDFRELTRRGSDAQGVGTKLEELYDLKGTVLTAANRNDAVPATLALSSVTEKDLTQLVLALLPVDLRAVFKVPTGAAHTLVVER
jgi:hypothetical protein